MGIKEHGNSIIKFGFHRKLYFFYGIQINTVFEVERTLWRLNSGEVSYIYEEEVGGC